MAKLSCNQPVKYIKKLILLPCIFLLSIKLSFGAANYKDKQCEKVKNTEIPLADQINPYGTTFQKNCDAEALYYGIGQETDVNKARVCAYSQRKEEPNNDYIYQGSGILMMLYANGEGVKRNIPLAKRFACEIGFDSYTLDNQNESTKIDICDNPISTYVELICNSHESHLAEMQRQTKLQIFKKKLTAEERIAFEKLIAAAADFISDHGQYEVGYPGAADAANAAARERAVNNQRDDFMDSLKHLEEHNMPHFQLKVEDATLDTLYQNLQHKLLTEGESYIIDADGIKITQKAWVKYRNTWIEFAKLKYPDYSADTISALLTHKRNDMLSYILADF